MAIGGALSAAFAFMLMRKMANRLYFMLPPFYFATWSSVIATPIALYQMSRQPTPTHYTWEGILYLFGVSVFAFIGQVAASRAYQLEKAGRVAPVNNIQLIMNLLFDVFILGSKLTAQEMLGALLIIFCNILISVLKCTGVIK